MTPIDFLKAIWPDTGYYCLATPFTIPNTTVRTYAHKTFSRIEDVVAFVDAKRHSTDMFFAVHTLKEPKVFNPEKENPRTGEMGAFEVRTQKNMSEARCFFFDLDVGETKPGRAPKYDNQAAAALDLKRFCAETGLPKPLVTSSGGGLHVYWPLTSAIPSPEWRQQAAKLRQLAEHHGLRADPARTTDTASVLRVAGTFNLKDRENPRKVKVLLNGAATPNGVFLKLLNDAVVRAGVTVRPLPEFHADENFLGSNLDEEFSGPPVTMRALVTACRQMQRLVKLKGDVSEPEWYHSINLVRFVEDGGRFVHKISEGHPDYDPAATDHKVAQLRAKNIKPTSCGKLAEVCGENICAGCVFAGKVKSPIVAARYKDPAPAPVVTEVLGAVQVVTEVPDPPAPFQRMKPKNATESGGIVMISTNNEGEEIYLNIYEHDLFPVRRVVNEQAEQEQQMWRVVLPRSGPKDFTISADALYDSRKFSATISNHGIYPKQANLKHLQDYMIAYIAELQRLADAEAQNGHLGWTDKERTAFIFPDKVVHEDGSVKPAALSLGAQRSSAAVEKRGTLQAQVNLLAFYKNPAYRGSQFAIMAALAAPIFYMTGHAGAIIHLMGDPGASKSTTLYTAASLWGMPTKFPLNGTNTGATPKARMNRVSVLANLPICVDEITHMPVNEAKDLALAISQPEGRTILDQTGTEKAARGGEKSTLMISTANSSLHGLLSQDNAAGTAGSMRVFELMLQPQSVHYKWEADDYLLQLAENYGHVGEQFIAYVIQHKAEVMARVRQVMREIDAQAKITSAERYWSAIAAAVIVAGEIAFKLGLLPYDVAAVRDWIINEQIPAMRGQVAAEYTTPVQMLTNYIAQNIADILVLAPQQSSMGNITYIQQKPRGQLLGRADGSETVLWLLKKGFKDHCAKTGAPYTRVLAELMARRVVVSTDQRKVLAAGTDYPKVQQWCFSVDLTHPDIAGVLEPKEIRSSNPPAQGGSLRLVQ